MPSNTKNLQLYKKDPATDGADNFNISTMLNDNWDKLDAAAGDNIAHKEERATPTTLGHVKAETDEDGNLILPEMSASNVTTTNGSNVQTEINSLKSSVSNGKLDVRNAITGKGGTVADADGDGVPTHAELAAGVQGIITPKTDKFRLHERVNISTMSYYRYGDFLDEDGIMVVGYSNTTGGDYRALLYDLTGSPRGETGNFGSLIKSISRSLTHYFLTVNNELFCFLLKPDGSLNSSPVWRITNTNNLEKVKYYDRKVYVSENSTIGRIKVYDASTGAFIKNIDIGAKNFYIPDFVASDGFLYVMGSSAVCHKVDINTGATLWSVTGLSVSGSGAHEITETQNYVYYMTSASQVTQIQKTDGAIIGTKNRGLPYSRLWADSFGNLMNYGGISIAFYGKEALPPNSTGTQTLTTSISDRIAGRKNFVAFGFHAPIKIMEPMYSI